MPSSWATYIYFILAILLGLSIPAALQQLQGVFVPKRGAPQPESDSKASSLEQRKINLRYFIAILAATTFLVLFFLIIPVLQTLISDRGHHAAVLVLSALAVFVLSTLAYSIRKKDLSWGSGTPEEEDVL